MKTRFVLLLALCSLGLFAELRAQEEEEKEEKGLPPMALLFDFSMGGQMPFGDMARRFLPNAHLGAKLQWLSGTNWIFGAFGDFQFRDDLLEDVLAPLRTGDGSLIDGQGGLVQVPLRQRGYIVGASVAKLIPLGAYKRSGLELRLGLGYWEHWVSMRILSENLLQLQGDYGKGYDRRTAGLCVQGFIGYRYLSKNKMINLFAGIDYTYGYTESLRPWHFDLREDASGRRADILLGFRGGISLPIYFYSERTDLGELEFY